MGQQLVQQARAVCLICIPFCCLQEADAIILVYDHGRRETLNNLGAVWLPLIQEVWGPDAHKPVVLAGNKVGVWCHALPSFANLRPM
jgi:hypothetical protein